ncbi:MAG: hypothetical protein QXD41_02555 [Nitrososphaeria archaeon]
MSIIVHTFPRSGNFLMTRAIAHCFENNLYHLVLGPRLIVDRSSSFMIDRKKAYLTSEYVYNLVSEYFGLPYPSTWSPLVKASLHSFVIYKSHSLPVLLELIKDNMGSEIKCIVVVLRKPTDILRSHVLHQYLHVDNLADSIYEHSKFVYYNQLNYMNNHKTLRSVLEDSHDSYLQAIINPLTTPLPIFMCTYDSLVKNTASIIKHLFHRVYHLNIDLPDNFFRNLSKERFIKVQEDILSLLIKSIGHPTWDGILCSIELLELTEWAYKNSMRVIPIHEKLIKFLKSLPPATGADIFYYKIAAIIPPYGLYLPPENSRTELIRTLLETTVES